MNEEEKIKEKLDFLEHEIKQELSDMRRRYLDPKNDLVFKRIFGQHTNLLINFLNEVLPLEEGNKIEQIEYIPTELTPRTPTGRNSIVDVNCIDSFKRVFIVEMQLFWELSFKNRLLFNASKAYTFQLERNSSYKSLQPVYSVGILNDVFDKDSEEFYHLYQIVNIDNPKDIIEGLQFVMIELPKFKPELWAHKKMAALWLRFLKEVNESVLTVPEDLADNPLISEALDICEEGGYSKEELYLYDHCWDSVRTLKGMLDSKYELGITKGKMEIAQSMLQSGFSYEQVFQLTGLAIPVLSRV